MSVNGSYGVFRIPPSATRKRGAPVQEVTTQETAAQKTARITANQAFQASIPQASTRLEGVNIYEVTLSNPSEVPRGTLPWLKLIMDILCAFEKDLLHVNNNWPDKQTARAHLVSLLELQEYLHKTPLEQSKCPPSFAFGYLWHDLHFLCKFMKYYIEDESKFSSQAFRELCQSMQTDFLKDATLPQILNLKVYRLLPSQSGDNPQAIEDSALKAFVAASLDPKVVPGELHRVLTAIQSVLIKCYGGNIEFSITLTPSLKEGYHLDGWNWFLFAACLADHRPFSWNENRQLLTKLSHKDSRILKRIRCQDIGAKWETYCDPFAILLQKKMANHGARPALNYTPTTVPVLIPNASKLYQDFQIKVSPLLSIEDKHSLIALVNHFIDSWSLFAASMSPEEEKAHLGFLLEAKKALEPYLGYLVTEDEFIFLLNSAKDGLLTLSVENIENLSLQNNKPDDPFFIITWAKILFKASSNETSRLACQIIFKRALSNFIPQATLRKFCFDHQETETHFQRAKQLTIIAQGFVKGMKLQTDMPLSWLLEKKGTILLYNELIGLSILKVMRDLEKMKKIIGRPGYDFSHLEGVVSYISRNYRSNIPETSEDAISQEDIRLVVSNMLLLAEMYPALKAVVQDKRLAPVKMVLEAEQHFLPATTLPIPGTPSLLNLDIFSSDLPEMGAFPEVPPEFPFTPATASNLAAESHLALNPDIESYLSDMPEIPGVLEPLQQEVPHVPVAIALPVIGIPNVGNSCFMNASLQALLGSSYFKTLVQQFNPAKEHLKPYSNHLKSLIGAISERNEANIETSARLLHEEIFSQKINPDFTRKGQQQDAECFISSLLSAMEYKLQWNKKVHFEIDGRPQESNTLESMSVLQLGMYREGKNYDIKTMLKETLDQAIDDPKNAYKAILDGKTTFLRKYQIKHHLTKVKPSLLVIQLKRYDQSGKITTPVQVPESIDLADYIDADLNVTPEGEKYRLVGTVNHDGPHPRGGHYRAFTRREDKWFLVSDANSREVPFDQVEKNTAYLLVYERQ